MFTALRSFRAFLSKCKHTADRSHSLGIFWGLFSLLLFLVSLSCRQLVALLTNVSRAPFDFQRLSAWQEPRKPVGALRVAG